MTPEALIDGHLALVKAIARGVHKRIPPNAHAHFDDLVQYGSLGLIAAARRFNPSSGVPFKRYCRHRIHGAILDGLRATDDFSRSQRKIRRHEQNHLGPDTQHCQPDPFLPDTLPSQELSPEEQALVVQRYAAVTAACAKLHSRDQLVIRLYYIHGRTMKEIGSALGVNESRISQLHGKAIDYLRQSLTGRLL